MKKSILIAAAAILAAAPIANAQESEWAPKAGDFSTAVEFNPFNGKDNATFSIDALSFRYFFADKHAILFDLGLNVKDAKNVPNTESDKNFSKYNYGKFSIDLGYEYHFKNFGRMDLFAGAKLGYSRLFAGGKESSYEYDEVSNTATSIETKYTNATPDGQHVAGNAIRFGVFTGFDFYVYKGLFVGAKLALELEDNLIVNTKTKTTSTYGGKVETLETESKRGGHDFDLNTLVHPQIHLGWTF